MKPSILITRPRDEAETFAAAVSFLGYTPVIEPLLSVELIPFDQDVTAQALVVTSPQVFKHQLPDAWKSLPVYVMGEASATKAKEQGFQNIISSGGDFSELCALLKKLLQSQTILYLRGETIRHDLKADLSGHTIIEQTVYKTIPLKTGLSSLKNGTIQVVTLFSPRSAVIFKECVAGNDGLVKGINLLCLSSAVLESVNSLPWNDIRVASQPDQQGMLDALRGWN